MGKKYLCTLLTAIMLICLSACSKGAPKIKCGVYRSENSDAYERRSRIPTESRTGVLRPFGARVINSRRGK